MAKSTVCDRDATQLVSTLPDDLDRQRLPHHVAVIMDGNGRWARQRGLPRPVGHRRGVGALKDLLSYCRDWGIGTLTAYAFSTENWHRPSQEVEFLLCLFERLLQSELDALDENDIRLHFIGELSELPSGLQRSIERARARTQTNEGVRFNVAVNYGGRAEILRACRRLACQVAEGRLSPDEIDTAQFARQLYTADGPDPDLLIRTSGELRLSNFLLWQVAYAELYVTDAFWPDFDRAEFHRALVAFQQRDRRFGQLKSSRDT
ncbi:undecaprenyl diphosphate synthase [Rubidibacter lacunae KORDI 51-2]|uniref:Isoprenyl transferase n=1 Tax=Rubidibacter lacunae KORDI 51-2 TaxID=582515 RepID=U5DEY7_9CHRO|nr:isoprenyl transferase [Rubidibacter lacunae]ERN43058.1 undecaprenyl diphosphate synthase [Rubidibacter lacunae KORDI 51-2]